MEGAACGVFCVDWGVFVGVNWFVGGDVWESAAAAGDGEESVLVLYDGGGGAYWGESYDEEGGRGFRVVGAVG